MKQVSKKGNVIVVWIPLSFLILASLLIVLFAYMRRTQQHTSSVASMPETVIQIDEHFSGKVHFNNNFGDTQFSTLLIEAIDHAKSSIEIAVYSMDHEGIRDALYRAGARGVRVVVLLSDKRKTGHDRVFKNLPKNVERKDIASVRTVDSSGSMHHKFMLVDRGMHEAKLFFGSYNFTVFQERYDPSFIMETTRPEIIKVFGEEFDRIYAEKQEGEITRNAFAARIVYPEGYLEIWFSPRESGTQSLRERFLGLIRESKNTINVLIWNLTDKKVANAFLEEAKENRQIKIVTDDYNFLGTDSVFPFIESEKELYNLSNLEILTDAKRNKEIEDVYGLKNFNSFLHQHLLLVDGDTAVFGTNNWSNNGFFNNYESVMITNIPTIFSSFKSTFEANYTSAL